MSKSGVVTEIEYSNCGAGQKSEPAQFTFYFLFHLTKFMKSSSAISALARHNLISPLFTSREAAWSREGVGFPGEGDVRQKRELLLLGLWLLHYFDFYGYSKTCFP